MDQMFLKNLEVINAHFSCLCDTSVSRFHCSSVMLISIVSSSQSSCSYHQLFFFCPQEQDGFLYACVVFLFLFLFEKLERVLVTVIGIAVNISSSVMLMCKQSSVSKREVKKKAKWNKCNYFYCLSCQKTANSKRGHDYYVMLWLILQGYYKKQWLISNDDSEVSEVLIQKFFSGLKPPFYRED